MPFVIAAEVPSQLTEMVSTDAEEEAIIRARWPVMVISIEFLRFMKGRFHAFQTDDDIIIAHVAEDIIRASTRRDDHWRIAALQSISRRADINTPRLSISMRDVDARDEAAFTSLAEYGLSLYFTDNEQHLCAANTYRSLRVFNRHA